MEKKIISVFGDSISTWQDVTPEGYEFYGLWNARETGVITVEDTWWMKVIRALDGQLGRNNSYSGCLVAGRSVTSGTSSGRIADLSANGAPDMILVAMGANDWGFGFPPDEFEKEYRHMIRLLTEACPAAEIWCATVPEGREPKGESFFLHLADHIPKRVFCDIIRNVVGEAKAAGDHVHVADLYASGREYSTIDGVHPDKQGMDDLYRMWMDEIALNK